MSSKLENLRNHYTKSVLTKDDMPKVPLSLFKTWMDHAMNGDIDEPNAFTLATANKESVPSARIVLLKGLTEKGFIFYSNYESRKAKEMDENPYVAAVFLWKEQERQVRIEGKVQKISKEDSQKYFSSRPKGSQISAVASPQSKVIEDYQELLDRRDQLTKEFEGTDHIPVPDYWGGYLILPHAIEFWQGRPNRFHDRFRYSKSDDSWNLDRLSP